MKFKNEQEYITLKHSLRKDWVRILPPYTAIHLHTTQTQHDDQRHVNFVSSAA